MSGIALGMIIFAYLLGSISSAIGVGNESSSMRGAANDLRNKAAAMGGNVIYGLGSPAESAIVSSLIPVDSKLTGQVFKCP